MYNQELTDDASRQFAGEDTFLATEGPTVNIVLQGASTHLDLYDELCTASERPDRALSVDEALVVRHTVAQR